MPLQTKPGGQPRLILLPALRSLDGVIPGERVRATAQLANYLGVAVMWVSPRETLKEVQPPVLKRARRTDCHAATVPGRLTVQLPQLRLYTRRIVPHP